MLKSGLLFGGCQILWFEIVRGLYEGEEDL